MAEQDAKKEIDFSLTHRVRRVSNAPDRPLHIFFNDFGRGLDFDTAKDGGSVQDVPACVAEAITKDESLAPHFRCEPIAEAAAAAVKSGPRKADKPAE